MRPTSSSPQWLCGDIPALDGQSTGHWPSKAGMSPQSYCGDEEDGCIGLSSRLHHVCITLLALCLFDTLCAMNQFLFLIKLHMLCFYIIQIQGFEHKFHMIAYVTIEF